ncbi:MAG: VOC family protein [Actinobacteria bacterium]|nr:VOC family protein [Actinomycetota bacterium]
MDSYAPGTPSWVDLASPDLDRSAAFYGELLGWEVIEPGPVEETGGYRMAFVRERPVAGMGPIMAEGQPPVWTTYVSVADAEGTAAVVQQAGGGVLMPPMDVLDQGRMAVFTDPSGAAFAVWQPRAHAGAGLVNEPGSLVWNELATRGPDAAIEFYGRVFGWRPDTEEVGGVPYTQWRLGESTVGGMMPMDSTWPDDVPDHWLVYFAVGDADAAVALTERLGGRVLVPAHDIPPGRFAVLQDPLGTMFAVLRLADVG